MGVTTSETSPLGTNATFTAGFEIVSKLDFVHLNGVGQRLVKASVKRSGDFSTVSVRT